jgi:hypothetical protein
MFKFLKMFLDAYKIITWGPLKILQKFNCYEAQRCRNAEIVSQKISLSSEFIINIESQNHIIDCKSLTVREKNK